MFLSIIQKDNNNVSDLSFIVKKKKNEINIKKIDFKDGKKFY